MKTLSGKSTVGRPADKMEMIVDGLRSAIIAGQLSPGTKLPTRVAIETEYQASSATVQRALAQLSRDGFVRVDQTRGTYVSSSLPHLTRYALIFPYLANNAPRNKMYASLTDAARGLRANEDINITSYELSGHLMASEEYYKLTEEIIGHRIAGLILLSVAPEWIGTPIMDEPRIPRVAVASGTHTWIPCVQHNNERLREMMIEHLREQGCQRIACVFASGYKSEPIHSAIVAAQLETRPYWLIPVDLRCPDGASAIVQLLLNPDQNVRPDGLVILDDNLTDFAIQGALAAGVRIGEDVKIAAHSNFPSSKPTSLPIMRVGFDAREVITACIEQVDAQRNGLTPTNVVIDPVLEAI
jgi:DNA-binding LacI/PurR family transcriptional regulator